MCDTPDAFLDREAASGARRRHVPRADAGDEPPRVTGPAPRGRIYGPMRIVVAATEALDEPTRAAIIRVCILAHGETSFERLFTYVPRGGRHFLAYVGRTLVGHAMVTRRWLHADGRRLRTAYVDAVATRPAYQGRGYGSAIMRHLAADIADDYEIACLETDRPGFYTRLGWELWRGSLAGVRDTQLLPTPDQPRDHGPAPGGFAARRPRRSPRHRVAGADLVADGETAGDRRLAASTTWASRGHPRECSRPAPAAS